MQQQVQLKSMRQIEWINERAVQRSRLSRGHRAGTLDGEIIPAVKVRGVELTMVTTQAREIVVGGRSVWGSPEKVAEFALRIAGYLPWLTYFGQIPQFTSLQAFLVS